MAQEQAAPRPSYSGTRSHGGRGGAGNVSSKPRQAAEANDFATPHIKSNTFTTGRGGAGNMATSSDRAAARAAQDVDTPAHHNKAMEGTYHWGRGGEGNMMNVGDKKEKKEKDGLTRVKSREERSGSKERSGSFKGVLDKGREILGLGGKKERSEASEKAGESAIE